MSQEVGSESLHIEKAVYGGDGLARTASGEVAFLPFVLPGETVERPGGSREPGQLHVVEPSPDRVAPHCVHFGTCGGCQYQMASYDAQLRIKREILTETLARAGLSGLPQTKLWPSPEPWGYRNRIRLQVREIDGELRVGYHLRGSEDFLPIRMCPIAAPSLWASADHLVNLARNQRDARDWLLAATEVELFCDADGERLQIHLLCPGRVPAATKSFARFTDALFARVGKPVSLAASQLLEASGKPGKLWASAGPNGLAYRVGDDTFWLRRGSFFQVNRFLIPSMVTLVLGSRSGSLAWDLFAGAGLFARALTRTFARVTAVEANPLALQELRRGLRAGTDIAISETVLNFLRKAVIQRDRPDLIVLDPPRAGAGEEACRLLQQLGPGEIVYISCDPTTLARDAAVLAGGGYHVTELHMLDLFPQTYHLETVMVFRRAQGETRNS